MVGEDMADVQENNFFVNEAIQVSFDKFVNSWDNKESLEYNSFMVVVIRALIFIYGADILESYQENNKKKFNEILARYGYDDKSIQEFRVNYEKFYRFDERQKDKAIHKKNKYFNLVQKSLIDMLVLKNSKEPISLDDKQEFYNLLFTANSKSFYAKSVAVLLAYNPYEIDAYYKKVVG